MFTYDNLFFEQHLYLPAGVLFQVSELSVIRSGEILEHIQSCDEITYAISGKAKIFTGDKCAEITGGQVCIIKKGIRHKTIADATTVWETADGAVAFNNAGSLCHGWSAIPIYYYQLLLQ